MPVERGATVGLLASRGAPRDRIGRRIRHVGPAPKVFSYAWTFRGRLATGSFLRSCRDPRPDHIFGLCRLRELIDYQPCAESNIIQKSEMAFEYNKSVVTQAPA